MSHHLPATNGLMARGTTEYTRHQPEQTLLYQVVEEYYPEFLSHLSESDKTLPQYVQNEFEEYLKCGRLEHGFLRVQCESYCQGLVRIIACIEDHQVINKILAHINRKQEPLLLVMAGAGIRAPPGDSNFLMTQ